MGPFAEERANVLAQACQVQIFFALCSAIALSFDQSGQSSKSLDVLLTTLTFVPLALTVLLRTPLVKLLEQRERTKLETRLRKLCCSRRTDQLAVDTLYQRDNEIRHTRSTNLAGDLHDATNLITTTLGPRRRQSELAADLREERRPISPADKEVGVPADEEAGVSIPRVSAIAKQKARESLGEQATSAAVMTWALNWMESEKEAPAPAYDDPMAV